MNCVLPFRSYGLHPAIIQGLEDSDYFRSTNLQGQVIRHSGAGDPLILMSPSGTGKTCAFVPLLFDFLTKKYFAHS
jgi:superfamily II DNA/RNA helicase